MATTNTSITLNLGDLDIDVEVAVPSESVAARKMLPAFRSITDGLVNIGIESSVKQGGHVSCKKGCGACCEMAVPVSTPEAERLREVVDEMPEPRRSEIRARFAASMDIFRDIGVLDKMFQRCDTDEKSRRSLRALEEYQIKRVGCPFLEEGSCSIYEERPLICRQFLVTSPAAYCERIGGEGVKRVPMAARPSDALIVSVSDSAEDRIEAQPLITIFEWSERPARLPVRTGPEWLKIFAINMADQATEMQRDATPALNLKQVLATAFPEGPEQLNARLPAAPVKPQAILPELHDFTNALVQISERHAEQLGKHASCKKGCAACCRQVVPISVPEAYQIRAMVDEMPEPRRGEIRARFVAALGKLAASGAVDGLLNTSGDDRDEIARYGLDYFAQRVACPFLEEESCSIHPTRPLSCREFLVTSPAVNCDAPSPETIRRVPLPAAPSRALMLSAPGSRAGKMPYVPLVAALDWTERNPDDLPEKPGVQWMNSVASRLQQLEKSRGSS